jgi:hypothetical protein
VRTVLIVCGLIGLIIIFGAAATSSSSAAMSSPGALRSTATPVPTAIDAPIEPPATDRPIAPTATAIAPVDAQRVMSEPVEPIDRAPIATATINAVTVKPTATPLSAAMEIPAVPVTPDVVNGVSIDRFLIMPPEVQQSIREIYANGQTLGRNAHSFSTAGDSTIETPYFLGPFSTAKYHLGGYAYLQPTVDFFAGAFGRESVAVRIGQHSWSVLNPVWADKKRCQPNESPLACEFRLEQPSVLIIRLGVNDSGVPKMFDTNLRKIVDYAIEQGVIPILSTKPDEREGTGAINDLVKQIAADYKLPLWDYEQVAKTLPGRGLGPDGAHMTSYSSADYRLEAAYSRGHAMQNLTALMVLDKVRQVLNP